MKLKHNQKYPKDVEEMDNEELKASQTYWEELCGSCDFFDTEDCPHLNKVSDLNNWKTEIRCNNYWS